MAEVVAVAVHQNSADNRDKVAKVVALWEQRELLPPAKVGRVRDALAHPERCLPAALAPTPAPPAPAATAPAADKRTPAAAPAPTPAPPPAAEKRTPAGAAATSSRTAKQRSRSPEAKGERTSRTGGGGAGGRRGGAGRSKGSRSVSRSRSRSRSRGQPMVSGVWGKGIGFGTCRYDTIQFDGWPSIRGGNECFFCGFLCVFYFGKI